MGPGGRKRIRRESPLADAEKKAEILWWVKLNTDIGKTAQRTERYSRKRNPRTRNTQKSLPTHELVAKIRDAERRKPFQGTETC